MRGMRSSAAPIALAGSSDSRLSRKACTSGWSFSGSESSQTHRCSGVNVMASSSNSPRRAISRFDRLMRRRPYSIAARSISLAFSHSRCTVRSVTSSVSAISCSL